MLEKQTLESEGGGGCSLIAYVPSGPVETGDLAPASRPLRRRK